MKVPSADDIVDMKERKANMAKRYKYRYETHVHTCNVSKCGKATVEEQVRFYASLGYDGIFITEHFMRGNCIISRDLPWGEQVEYYCSSYEQGVEYGKKYGIKVFFGMEVSFFSGSDLLVYGIDKAWIKKHPEIMTVTQDEFCDIVHESGGFIVHAHPFREAAYIVMSGVLPDREDAVEIYNPNCLGISNKMAGIYAKEYGLPVTGGSDNHAGHWQHQLYGYETKEPLNCEADYIRAVKNREGRPFELYRETVE